MPGWGTWELAHLKCRLPFFRPFGGLLRDGAARNGSIPESGRAIPESGGGALARHGCMA